MVTKMFAVYDAKVETFLNPFVQRTVAEAKRSFQQIANDLNTAIGKYPEDYCLMEIGEWDDSKGLLRPHPAPISHGLALNYRRQEDVPVGLTKLTAVSDEAKVVQ